MRAWWIFAVLIACGDAGRARDCDELAAMVKPVRDMPTRYAEWSDLATHDWQNPDVRAAVKAFLAPSRIARAGRDPVLRSLSRSSSLFTPRDTGWTLYTPYTVHSDPGGPVRISDHGRGASRFAALHDVCPAIASD